MKLQTDLNGVDGGVKKSVFTMLADNDAHIALSWLIEAI